MTNAVSTELKQKNHRVNWGSLSGVAESGEEGFEPAHELPSYNLLEAARSTTLDLPIEAGFLAEGVDSNPRYF